MVTDPSLINAIDWQTGLTNPTSVPLAPIGSATTDTTPSTTATAPAPTNPNGTSTTFADKSNDIALQKSGLGAVDTQTTAGLSAIDKALGNLFSSYDTEKTANEGNYKTQSDTNQGNLQSNKETALVNAAQGRRGLFGTLASLGALSGSGVDLANEAVQNGANEDLSGAANNYASNQTGLDNAIGAFRTADQERRDQANNSADNARTNVHNDAAKSRQQFLTGLANDYAAEGDTATAKTYADQAAALYPEIASTDVPNSNIAYTGAAFTPGTLANYLAGANGTTVSVAPPEGGGGLPTLVARGKKQTA